MLRALELIEEEDTGMERAVERRPPLHERLVPRGWKLVLEEEVRWCILLRAAGIRLKPCILSCNGEY